MLQSAVLVEAQGGRVGFGLGLALLLLGGLLIHSGYAKTNADASNSMKKECMSSAEHATGLAILSPGNAEHRCHQAGAVAKSGRTEILLPPRVANVRMANR